MKPVRIDELDIRTAGDDVLVHDRLHGKVHVLNATAGLVLQLCDGNRSPDDIAASVRAATGADIAIVARDVRAVLETFVTLRLIIV